MTTNENMAEEVAQDPISQAQANLDLQQEAVVSSDLPGLTPEMQSYISSKIAEANAAANKQIAGLQGKVDKALNTIRRDSETAAISAARKQVTQELNTLLQSEELDDQQLAYVRQLRNREQQLDEQMGQVLIEPQPVQAEPQVGASPMTAAREVAISHGVSPDDLRIDYASLENTSLSTSERLMRFTKSLEAISSNMSVPVAQPPTPPQQGQPRTVNPPVEPGPAQSTSFSNEDEVLTAYISGTISGQERDQRLKSLGSDLTFRK